MMLLFDETGLKIKTNEEFRRIVEKKKKIMGMFCLLGAITVLADAIAATAGLLESDSYLCGLFLGLGCGLIGAGLLKLLQLKKISSNEELLKKERLKYTDERNRAITSKAILMTTLVILLLSYLAMLIGAFYSRTVFYCFWFVLIGFFFLYAIFFRHYNRKM